MTFPPHSRRAFVRTAIFSSLALNASAAVAGERLRVAVIGHTGAGDYGHGLDTMWLALPETEIVGVADANPVGLEKAKARLGLSAGFSDYREMLAALKPDLVAIAPRHMGEHRDMALAAIRGGIKGIYMEKPFCRTVAEADGIVAAAAEKKVKIALAHRNRYHPALRVVKKLVEEGAIGRLLEIRCRGKEDARGGMQDLWVLGSHLLNLAVYFAGDPVSCSAAVLKGGRPVTKADVVEGKEGIGPIAGDEVHARYEMKSGVPVFFDSIANAGVAEAGFGLQLIGTKGIFDLRIDSEPLAHLLAGNPFQPVAEPRKWVPVTSGGIGVPEPLVDIRKGVGGHHYAARDLIAAIREDRAPLCSAEDGAVTVRMISMVKVQDV